MNAAMIAWRPLGLLLASASATQNTDRGCACLQNWNISTTELGVEGPDQTRFVSTYCGNPDGRQARDFRSTNLISPSNADLWDGISGGPFFGQPMWCEVADPACQGSRYGACHVPLTCEECVAEGSVWCAAAASCRGAVPPISELIDQQLEGDATFCPTSASWTSTCASSPFVQEDPAFDAQSWVYEMVGVGGPWAEGYSGKGVQMAINDDGIDLLSPDFGPLADGTPKFDVRSF